MKFLNVFKHTALVLRHKHKVFWHCVKCGLIWRGIVHDLSKFSPTEFFESVKYYQGNRSPIGVCRRVTGISRAWLHHKGRNKHHFEYWRDYSMVERRNVPVQMPMRFFVEMVCDRIAASKIYRGEKYTDSHPLEYFQNSSDTHDMHPKTAAYLTYVLTMLAECGEEKTFAYLRSLDKKQEGYPPFGAN